MDDPEATQAKFRGVRFSDLEKFYRVFCKRDNRELPVDISQVIEFYNRALQDLPDHMRLRNLALPGTTTILDGNGQPFADIYEPAQHRVSVPLEKVAKHVQEAFIAAEDKRFYQHKGIDERGLIRAFMSNLAGSGSLQGGSTITQQVAKNLLVGSETSYVRKMREMVVASRMERTLTKSEILQLYLNVVFLGRGAWGIEMAARNYFGKSAESLSIAEAAFLAGLVKGPTFYNPDRHRSRAHDRYEYVLNRMRQDGMISDAEMEEALKQSLAFVPYPVPRRTSGFYFVDYLAQEAKRLKDIKLLTADSYRIRSTIDPDVQKAAEAALQEGLAAYERRHGRAKFTSAEANLSKAIKRIETKDTAPASSPGWQQALMTARLPLYDVHWQPAIVFKPADEKRTSQSIETGLEDGRILPLAVPAAARAKLAAYDVVYVQPIDGEGGKTVAELRVRPEVQGAVVVLENKTGRILADVGGFSYPLSQLNRTTQAKRQPGSAIKPVTYLAALAKGLQPNTLVRDSSITLPPIGGPKHAKAEAFWSPENYGGHSAGGTLTIRQALERSRNLATTHLFAEGIAESAKASLDKVCGLAIEAQIYPTCIRYYPFVLGAQPVRPIDLARFYAAIANEGMLPTPYTIESIEQSGTEIYRRQGSVFTKINAADAPAFYQLKSIMQGVVRRGTAARLADLSPYIAGKTGTTDDETDAWFVGFSNEVTIAVWVGYDNAHGKRRTLGAGSTGANVAIPIFEPIMQAVWAHHAPKTPLAPPSDAAARELVAVNMDSAGTRRSRGNSGWVEYMRRTANGGAKDTRYALVSHAKPRRPRNPRPENSYASVPGFREWQPWSWQNQSGGWNSDRPRDWSSNSFTNAPENQYRHGSGSDGSGSYGFRR
jgi:1A family penicillin-binding protein